MSATYERAANLYYRLKALPWWALVRRYRLRVELNDVWEENNR